MMITHKARGPVAPSGGGKDHFSAPHSSTGAGASPSHEVPPARDLLCHGHQTHPTRFFRVPAVVAGRDSLLRVLTEEQQHAP